MPELPEVETVRAGLAPHVAGARIDDVVLGRADLRFAFPNRFAARLKGRTITGLGRRAKYLLFNLDNSETLLSHLGMTGNYRLETPAPGGRAATGTPAGAHDHVLLMLATSRGERVTLVYSDPRRFGYMDIYDDVSTCRWLAHLGPEPLGNELSAVALARRIFKRNRPVKSVLLDQRNVAGLGNIYVSEALWRAGIAPTTPAGHLVAADGAPDRRLEALVAAIRGVLTEAIAAGGATLRDFRNLDGGAGYFQHAFDVYGRDGATCRKPGCGGVIARIVQSGRSSFYCPACQPEIG